MKWFGIICFCSLWWVAAAHAADDYLERCIQTALEENPGIEAAARRLEAARAKTKQAVAAFHPQLSVSGSYARTDNPPQAFMMALNQRALNFGDPSFNANEPSDTDNVRLTTSVRWRLFDGGRRRIDRAMAANRAAVFGERLSAVQNELIFRVAEAYYHALQAKAFIRVQRDTVDSFNHNLRLAQERLNAGTTVRTDVLNLEVRLASAQEDLVRAQHGLQLGLAALNTLIGKPFVEEKHLALADAMEHQRPATVAAEDVAAERPEMRAARIMTETTEQALARAKRDYAPTVSAFGSLDWDSDSIADFEESYMVGAMAEVNIFEGFRRRHAVREASAEWAAATAEEQTARNDLSLDQKQAVLREQAAWERIKVTRKSVETAEEALRITRERYEQGAADITELLTAQVGLTAIRTRNIAASYDYLTAVSNHERSRGALVERYLGSAPAE